MTTTPKPAPAGYTAVFGDTGFNKYVGPVWQSPDGKEFLFDVRDIHLNGGHTLHGGMAMALADIVMGRSVRDALDGQTAMTISLNCDLIGPARLGDRIRGSATITRKTRSIVFISSELTVDGKPILTATGLWKIVGTQA
ncbi:MAG: PaaI family thioesterase [Alphaproteobacteria bacterium]|nr:PaaI family thioesterase [Alphaproteobacteria bacterium]